MEKRYAIWINSGRMVQPAGGQWLMRNGNTIASFDSFTEAYDHLFALGYRFAESHEPGRPTGYVAQNPRWWDEGIDRAERALGVE